MSHVKLYPPFPLIMLFLLVLESVRTRSENASLITISIIKKMPLPVHQQQTIFSAWVDSGVCSSVEPILI